jgi:hypothetical protein
MTLESDLRKLFVSKYGSLSQAQTEVRGAKTSIEAFKALVDQLPAMDRGSRIYSELDRRLTEASNALSIILDGSLR